MEPVVSVVPVSAVEPNGPDDCPNFLIDCQESAGHRASVEGSPLEERIGPNLKKPSFEIGTRLAVSRVFFLLALLARGPSFGAVVLLGKSLPSVSVLPEVSDLEVTQFRPLMSRDIRSCG